MGNKVDYKQWARGVWGHNTFSYNLTVMGQPAVLSRYREEVNLRTLEWGDSTWQESGYSTATDKLVPAIEWLMFVPHHPTLVEIKRAEHSTWRVLLAPDEPRVVRATEGRVLPSSAQTRFIMTERVKELVGCNTKLAKALTDGIRDVEALRIIHFAAYLFQQYGSQKHEAVQAIEVLWRFEQKDICSVIPPRFHAIATTERHSKIKGDLLRCITLMTQPES